MNTKIVYVLVSQETDCYYEMLLLSLYSLRRHHPNELVEVVMDNTTYQRLFTSNNMLLKEVTPVVVSIPPEYTVMQRSRYLKTSLRQIVAGDFLYLDSDTLICKRLDSIDSVNADLAMVANEHHGTLDQNSINYEKCLQAGFDHLESAPYFNSGVIFSRDNVTSHQFFQLWHSLWEQSIKNGVPQDQPALCQTNVYSGLVLTNLPNAWNCQLFCFSDLEDLNNAFIFHYFTIRDSLLKSILLEHIKKSGKVDDIAASVAKKPCSLGFTVFSMNDKKALSFIYSDYLTLFEFSPKLFRLSAGISRLAIKPIMFLSKLKRSFCHK